MNKALLAFHVLALALAAHLVYAAEDAPKENAKPTAVEAAFNAADTNGDGGLSRDELAKTPETQFKAIKESFDKMDTDKDGKVTVEERNKWIKNQRYRFGK